MTSQRSYVNLALICLCLFLAGCASQAQKSNVSFMVFGDPEEFAAFQNLVTTFNAKHPTVNVELSHVPGQAEYRQRIAASFSSGSPPNVMLINYVRMPFFAVQGGLEPLGGYLEQSDLIQASDFFEIPIKAFTLNDKLWCIPQNTSSLVVYYNRDLFDAAGLPYPTAGWRWEDFVETARALTKDTDGDGTIDQYGAGITPRIMRLAPFIWQSGGNLVDAPANPTQLTLDDPAALEAFRWFVGLQTEEHIVPDAKAEAAETGENRFLNGRLAMYFNSRRGVPTYRTISSFAWDVAPLPQGEQEVGILHSDGYCMAANTENKQAAWTFIEFANSPEGQALVAASGRTVPSLRSVAESSAFLEPEHPPANSRVFVDQLATMRALPSLTTWPQIEEAADEEIQRAFYGQISVEEAAQSARTLTQPAFDQAAQDREIQPE